MDSATVRRSGLPTLRSILVLAMTIAAAVWGGGVTLPAKAALAAAMAGTILACPPERRPAPALAAAGGVLLLACAIPLLPVALAASWNSGGWRATVVEDLEIPLGGTVSPQPWVAAEGILLLGAFLAWGIYLFSCRWSPRERAFLLRWWAAAIVAIAAAAAVASALGFMPPFWRSVIDFGPFANRNHFASLLVLGAVVALGHAAQAARRRRRSWIPWLLATVFLFGIIIRNNSRAGIVLFFVGVVAWLSMLAFTERSPKTFGLGASAVALLGSLFLVFGGPLRDRFASPEGWFSLIREDGRVRIFRDAARLIREEPLGVGLGSFESVFPFFSSDHLDGYRALFPESDWLWIGSEGGIASLVAAVALALVVAALLLSPVKKALVGRTDARSPAERRLRLAAAVAALLPAVHGLFDVPLHVPGVLLHAMLLGALAKDDAVPARNPRRSRQDGRFRFSPVRLLSLAPRPGPARGLRGLAVVPAAAAAWITASIWHPAELPGGTAAGWLATTWGEATPEAGTSVGDRFAAVDRAVTFRPLDWRLYFLRAQTGVPSGAPIEQVRSDFRRARLLAPETREIAFREAALWAAVDMPELAITPLRFVIETHPHRATETFQEILRRARTAPAFQEAARDLADSSPELAVAYTRSMAGAELAAWLDQLRHDDPWLERFGQRHLAVILGHWSQRGNREALMRETGQDPSGRWSEILWPDRARHLAANARVREACELIFQHMPRPPMPTVEAGADLEQLRNRFLANKDDVVSAIQFTLALDAAGDTDRAAKVLAEAATYPNPPEYLDFLEARIRADQGDWTGAWKLLAARLAKSPK